MTEKEILNLLPSSWKELKLRDYQNFSSILIDESDEVFAGANNTINIIAAITGLSKDEIEEMPLSSIQAFATKLEFIVIPPKLNAKASNIKWKKLEDISYDAYITFIQLQKDPIKNLDQIIKAFAKDMSDEEIDNISVEEAMNGFFLLVHVSKKLVKNMISETKKKLKRLKKKTSLISQN